MEQYILKEKDDGSIITVADVQVVLLRMLKDIDELCKKHQIPYFLNGGSALGAIRHKGFIPWDDDVDIAMMKSDFDRFIEVCKLELSDAYVAQCYKTHPCYNVLIPGMKIRKKTTYVKEVNTLLQNKCKDSDGLFIDVFVYDHMSNKKWIDLPFRLFNQLLMPMIILLENLKVNPVWLKSLFMFVAKFYGRLNKNSDYVGFDLTWTFKSPFRPFIFKKSDIFPVKYVPFEDTMFPVAQAHHEYLCVAIAPSYMTPPPMDKRAPKHIVDIEL